MSIVKDILQRQDCCQNKTICQPRCNWHGALGHYVGWIVIFISFLLVSCNNQSASLAPTPVLGCDGQTYIDQPTSPYVLPFAVGETFKTGLTNCSSSYHGAGEPDQYAFDFNMPVGTQFMAARAGTVYEVVEDASSTGGGVGNYVFINHNDGTFGLYFHSPENGIEVEVGDEVEQGDVLGVTGRSGLAGYPHLHFIVVKDPPIYPYEGIAISFRNNVPADVVLKSHTSYQADAH